MKSYLSRTDDDNLTWIIPPMDITEEPKRMTNDEAEEFIKALKAAADRLRDNNFMVPSHCVYPPDMFTTLVMKTIFDDIKEK